MTIDRHNYEEYFLLYVDNELSPEERRLVEAFAQRHPDLGEELELLQQFRAEPDTTISFPEKESLYRTVTPAPVNDYNYQEWLLLYTDNELNQEQRAAVEAYIATHPAAAAEQAWLEKTVFQPEAIPFPDKNSLYRKEEKRRTIPFRYWRAAAAVFLLFAALGTALVTYNTGDPASGETARVYPVPPNTASSSTASETNNRSTEITTTNPVAAEYTKGTHAGGPKADEKKNAPAYAVQNESTRNRPQNTPANNPAQGTGNNLPLPDHNPNMMTDVATNPVRTERVVPEPEPESRLRPLTNPTVTIPSPQPYAIAQASYHEPEEAVFDQADGKKNKLRGFFRKVTRTFEKRTDIDPTDDNRLLVAGLSIRLN